MQSSYTTMHIEEVVSDHEFEEISARSFYNSSSYHRSTADNRVLQCSTPDDNFGNLKPGKLNYHARNLTHFINYIHVVVLQMDSTIQNLQRELLSLSSKFQDLEQRSIKQSTLPEQATAECATPETPRQRPARKSMKYSSELPVG